VNLRQASGGNAVGAEGETEIGMGGRPGLKLGPKKKLGPMRARVEQMGGYPPAVMDPIL